MVSRIYVLLAEQRIEVALVLAAEDSAPANSSVMDEGRSSKHSDCYRTHSDTVSFTTHAVSPVLVRLCVMLLYLSEYWSCVGCEQA